MKHHQTMRRGLGILLALVLCLSLLPATALAAEGDVEINETNFPDDNFRTYVSENLDDGDGTLSAEEIAEVTTISCSSKEISDLTGIAYFTALEHLVHSAALGGHRCGHQRPPCGAAATRN